MGDNDENDIVFSMVTVQRYAHELYNAIPPDLIKCEQIHLINITFNAFIFFL